MITKNNMKDKINIMVDIIHLTSNLNKGGQVA